MLKYSFKNIFKAKPLLRLAATIQVNYFSKTLAKHVRKTNYKKIAKIVDKYRLPKIKLKRYKGFATSALRQAQD